jgi:hypothetical protein
MIVRRNSYGRYGAGRQIERRIQKGVHRLKEKSTHRHSPSELCLSPLDCLYLNMGSDYRRVLVLRQTETGIGTYISQYHNMINYANKSNSNLYLFDRGYSGCGMHKLCKFMLWNLWYTNKNSSDHQSQRRRRLTIHVLHSGFGRHQIWI